MDIRTTVTVIFPCTSEEWDKLVQLKNITEEIVPKVSTPKNKNVPTELLVSKEESYETPILDFMEQESVGKMKPNYSEIIRTYVRENPGKTRNEVASELSLKLGRTIEQMKINISYLLRIKHSQTPNLHIDKNGILSLSS